MVVNIFPTTVLIYRSAIYPQGLIFEFGLGGCRRSVSLLVGFTIKSVLGAVPIMDLAEGAHLAIRFSIAINQAP